MPSVVEACGAAIKKSPPSAQPKYLQHRDTGVSKKTFQAWSMYTHTHGAGTRAIRYEIPALHGMFTGDGRDAPVKLFKIPAPIHLRGFHQQNDGRRPKRRGKKNSNILTFFPQKISTAPGMRPVSLKLILNRSEVKSMSAGHLRSARLSGYMVLLRLSLSDRLATFSENEMKFFPKKILGAFGTESGRGGSVRGQWTLTLDDKSLMSRSNSWRRWSRGRKGVTSVTGTRPVSCSPNGHISI